MPSPASIATTGMVTPMAILAPAPRPPLASCGLLANPVLPGPIVVLLVVDDDVELVLEELDLVLVVGLSVSPLGLPWIITKRRPQAMDVDVETDWIVKTVGSGVHDVSRIIPVMTCPAVPGV